MGGCPSCHTCDSYRDPKINVHARRPPLPSSLSRLTRCDPLPVAYLTRRVIRNMPTALTSPPPAPFSARLFAPHVARPLLPSPQRKPSLSPLPHNDDGGPSTSRSTMMVVGVARQRTLAAMVTVWHLPPKTSMDLRRLPPPNPRTTE